MPLSLRSSILALSLIAGISTYAQENRLRHYTLLVNGIDSNLKVKLLIEALMNEDPSGDYRPEDALFTRTIRVATYQQLDLATVKQRMETGHFEVKAMAHGDAPLDVLQGAANITGEPYLIETGDPANDQLRYADAKHVWEAAHPQVNTTTKP